MKSKKIDLAIVMSEAMNVTARSIQGVRRPSEAPVCSCAPICGLLCSARALPKVFVGIGRTVEDALQAFDAQYLATLRPPAPSKTRRAGSRGFAF